MARQDGAKSPRSAPEAAPASAVEAVRAQLRAKRRELSQAERAAREAEEQMNASALVEAQQRIEALKGFIARLEAQAGEAREEDARDRAKAWLAAHEARMETVRVQLAAARERVHAQLVALDAAIDAEREVRKGAEAAVLGAQVLAARFALPAAAERVGLPPLEDYSVGVMRAVDTMRPSRQARLGIKVGHRSSATAEEMRRDVLRAVHDWLAQFAAQLPAEVQGILADAPVPADVLPAPKKGPSANEVRQMERAARDAAALQRALDAVPGASGVVSL